MWVFPRSYFEYSKFVSCGAFCCFLQILPEHSHWVLMIQYTSHACILIVRYCRLIKSHGVHDIRSILITSCRIFALYQPIFMFSTSDLIYASVELQSAIIIRCQMLCIRREAGRLEIVELVVRLVCFVASKQLTKFRQKVILTANDAHGSSFFDNGTMIITHSGLISIQNRRTLFVREFIWALSHILGWHTVFAWSLLFNIVKRYLFVIFGGFLLICGILIENLLSIRHF